MAKDDATGGRLRKWVTNDGAEFINSLCPNSQYPFPRFEWCSDEERAALEDACSHAFHTFKQEWQKFLVDRLRHFTLNQNRALSVIEMKTLRFNKLLEKIPRLSFSKGEAAIDRHGFPIVPKSGLDDRKLSTVLAELRRRDAVGCVKANQHNGRDPSNIYCVVPVYVAVNRLLEVIMDPYDHIETVQSIGRDRWEEMFQHLRREVANRCNDISLEDCETKGQTFAAHPALAANPVDCSCSDHRRNNGHQAQTPVETTGIDHRRNDGLNREDKINLEREIKDDPLAAASLPGESGSRPSEEDLPGEGRAPHCARPPAPRRSAASITPLQVELGPDAATDSMSRQHQTWPTRHPAPTGFERGPKGGTDTETQRADDLGLPAFYLDPIELSPMDYSKWS